MSKRANSSPCHHEGKKVLLVEGNTDCHVVMALCQVHQVENNLFGLYDCGSDDLALRRLNALINAPATDRPAIIGLLLDADQQGPESRWRSIRQKLLDKPYELPDVPVASGTVLDASEPDYPRLGFWLMPNNQTTGMLEDFVNEMLPAPCVELIEQCLLLARESGAATYKPAHQAKAIVHTYLAWQDEPGHPIGLSITAKVLQPTTATAYRFTEWLGALFSNSI
ncbi:MAG: hypothetical protein EOO63_17600 [Hymenobacter sp.]|nr:MAG: hypothetical protein EOO63_17600 [Hymenobacter sp.]